jgi:hypothetical protein
VQPPGLDTCNYTLPSPSTPFDIIIRIFSYTFYSLYPLHSSPPVPLSTLTRDVRGAWERSRLARARGLAAVPELSDPPDNPVDFRRALGKLSNGFRIVYSKYVLVLLFFYFLFRRVVILLASISLHLISSLLR